MPYSRAPKPTIKDIAKMCGVSAQTVSRVLNNRHDVSPETRAAIEAAIAQVGYRPSALARSLVQQRSRTLGVIVAGLRYLGVALTLNGIAEACENAGYALFVKELARLDTPTNIMPIIESLMAHQVEGIIFAAPEFNENVKLAQSQLPVSCPPIVFLKCHPNPNYDTINIDNYGGACKAVEFLLAAGRRHVGLIAGPLGWLEAHQRRRGWEDTLKRFGMTAGNDKWARGDWSSASGESAFAELLGKYPLMDAVFISNDQMALGALHLAGKRGLRIPDDIAMIGFDNLDESAYYTPSLSTVNHPLRELGTLAVQNLLQRVEGGAARQSGTTTTLPTELVLRDSTPRLGQ